MSLELKDITLHTYYIAGIGIHLSCIPIEFALRTGGVRRKCKLEYPAITGHVDFERAYRAQQNTLEFFPVFATVFWMAGLFFHQLPVGIVGVVYVYARQIYYNGYCKSVNGRLPGFKLSAKCLRILLFMFAVGLVNVLLAEYAGINIKDFIMKYLPIP